MPRTQQLKQQATLGVLIAVLLFGGAGCIFFYLALRPCAVNLSPGTIVRYHIVTESCPVYQQGKKWLPDESQMNTEHMSFDLMCISPNQEMALITDGGPGERDEMSILQKHPNGRTQRFDAAMRLLPDGKALRFFDFNLFILPKGMEQHFRTTVHYAPLPPNKREIQCQVRRLENGLRPVFELKPLSTIEWVERRAQPRYLQIKDLRARYHFNRSIGLVDQAKIDFIAGKEVEQGVKRRYIRMRMQAEVIGKDQDTLAMRDLIFAVADVQHKLEDNRKAGLRPLVQRLQQANSDHERLRSLAHQLARAAYNQTPEIGSGNWAIQVATGSADGAEHLRQELIADGFSAFIREQGHRYIVYVGPFSNRNENVMRIMQKRYPRNKPLWRRLGQ